MGVFPSDIWWCAATRPAQQFGKHIHTTRTHERGKQKPIRHRVACYSCRVGIKPRTCNARTNHATFPPQKAWCDSTAAARSPSRVVLIFGTDGPAWTQKRQCITARDFQSTCLKENDLYCCACVPRSRGFYLAVETSKRFLSECLPPLGSKRPPHQDIAVLFETSQTGYSPQRCAGRVFGGIEQRSRTCLHSIPPAARRTTYDP